MGGNKSDKLKDKALEQVMQQNQTAYHEQLHATNPGPVEEAMNKRWLDWTKATDGTTPLQVEKLPGMSPHYQMYQRAANRQASERTGLGSLRMGADTANLNLASQQARYDKLRREQEAAGELENAYGATNAEITGTGLPLVGTAASRDANKLGVTGQQAESSLGNWSRFQIRPGFWQQFALAGIKGASDVAASYYTGGFAG